MILIKSYIKSSHVLVIVLAFACILASLHTQAAEIKKDELWINAYLRGSAMIDNKGNAGRDPSDGADFELTLFDEPYAEIGLQSKVNPNLNVFFQVGLDNKNVKFLTDNPTTDWTLQNFYGEFSHVTVPGSTLWMGSRKLGIIDEHQLFGFGYSQPVSQSLKIAMHYGMSANNPFWAYGGFGGNEITQSPKPYRHMLLLSSTLALDHAEVVSLVEPQWVTPVAGTRSSGFTSYKYSNLPAMHGLLTGVAYNGWTDQSNTSAALSLSYGDIRTGPLSKLNSKGVLKTFTDDTGTDSFSISEYKNNSWRMTATVYGSESFSNTDYSFLLAMSRDWLNGANNKMQLFAQSRPFYHLTPHWHVGADLSVSKFSNFTYFKSGSSDQLARPSMMTLAPTVRYSLGRNQPQLMIFYAVARYAAEVQFYSTPARTTQTAGIQVEAWF